jgi:hypothetical protein
MRLDCGAELHTLFVASAVIDLFGVASGFDWGCFGWHILVSGPSVINSAARGAPDTPLIKICKNRKNRSGSMAVRPVTPGLFWRHHKP